MTLLLIGANPESTNRGVAALGAACIDNLTTAFPGVRLLVSVKGMQSYREVQLPDRAVQIEACSVHSSSRLRVRSSTRHLGLLHLARRITPGLGTRLLPNLTFQQLLSCDAVLDIGGGDSFADTYTPGVFAAQTDVKRLVLAMAKPLVLLPQTIGPFRHERSRSTAREILSRSHLVATRDVDGLQELRQLIGDELDERFVSCPDVAFTLRGAALAEGAVRLPAGDGPLIGLNVSGLLWDSNVQFGLLSDYRKLTRQLVDWCMRQNSSRLLLVPHMFRDRDLRAIRSGAGFGEDSDLAVCQDLANELRPKWGDRIASLDRPYSAAELKTIIGWCDFFIGARMHACIAGVSQALPTVTLAYSKKAVGVMGTVGAEELVVDLRDTSIEEVTARVAATYSRRESVSAKLRASTRAAQQQVRDFFRRTLPASLNGSYKGAH